MRVLDFVSLVSQAVVIAARPSCGQLYNPVNLAGYGKFAGTTVNTSFSGQPLPKHVDAWLGMDFGTIPERFSPAQWAAPFRGVKNATKYGTICVQESTATHPESEQSEDCLNFNVYRTPGVPLHRKLPVLVWIYGGAFFFGSYKSFDGASFAASSKDHIVVVTFNYRVNSLGFLPSTLFHEEGLSNLGIRDQRLFLEFMEKHVKAFGGDPDNITLGGRSAGGHSVGIHYFHNYGKDAGRKPLFARAIHQSGSVTSRAFPDVTYPLYQSQYAEYMAYIGCEGIEGNAETLACLRSADIKDIRDISTKIFWENHPNVTWPFQPVQGGPLFEKTGTQSGIDGTFFHVPTISSTTSDEGKAYLPGTFETNEEFLGYMHNGSPALNATDLELLESLYPDPATDQSPNSPFANSPNSTQYNRLSAAWSDYGYACPSQETSYRTSAAGVPTWKLRFNTNNRYPDWQGIPHASDTRYTWNDPTVQYPEISPIYHGYLSSFVTRGNPNVNRHPGSPKWLQYKPKGYGLDAKPGKQLVVQPGDTKMEDDDIRRDACLYWRDPERAPRLSK